VTQSDYTTGTGYIASLIVVGGSATDLVARATANNASNEAWRISGGTNALRIAAEAAAAADATSKTNALDGIVIARNYLTAESQTLQDVANKGNTITNLGASTVVGNMAFDNGSGTAPVLRFLNEDDDISQMVIDSSGNLYIITSSSGNIILDPVEGSVLMDGSLNVGGTNFPGGDDDLRVGGDATIIGAHSAASYTGDGSGLTNLPAAELTGNVPQAAITNACDPRYVNTNEAGSVTGLMLSLTNVPVVDYIMAFDADSNLFAKAEAGGGVDLNSCTGDGNANFTGAVQAVFATITNTYTIGVQDPTNTYIYWTESMPAASTLTEVYAQTEGMTGVVQVLYRHRTNAWGSYSAIDPAIAMDLDGTVDSSFATSAIPAGYKIGILPSAISAFAIDHKFQVDFKVTR